MNNKLTKPLLMGLTIFLTIALVGSIFAGAASATTVNNHKKVIEDKKIQHHSNVKISKQKAVLIAKLHYPYALHNNDMTINVSLSSDRKIYLIKVKQSYSEYTQTVMVSTATGTSKIDHGKWIPFNKLKAIYVANLYNLGLVGADTEYGTPKEITVHGKKLLKVTEYSRPLVPNPGPYKISSWVYFDDKTGKSLKIENYGNGERKWMTLKDLDYMLAQRFSYLDYEKNILRNWYPE